LKCLITGICGQDGAYLAKLLEHRGFDIIGIDRPRSSLDAFARLQAVGCGDIKILNGDISDKSFLSRVCKNVRPDAIFNLAAESFVGSSWNAPTRVLRVNADAVLHLCELVRSDFPDTKLYQASTSEMFGGREAEPLNELSRMEPNSPYAIAKLAAHGFVRNYRESFNLFMVAGILFNHESPLRGDQFVTQKIIKHCKKIGCLEGPTRPILKLGNLNAIRDWGYAAEYMQAACQMMFDVEKPDDFVIGTGKGLSVRDFASIAFELVGRPVIWVGSGLSERAVFEDESGVAIEVTEEYYRPAEVNHLIADSSKAKEQLDWAPKTFGRALVAKMINDEF